MTRQDFNKLANIISMMSGAIGPVNAALLADYMADHFESRNSRFDRKRWRLACLQDGKAMSGSNTKQKGPTK